jgi:hypothetical protein
MPDATIKHILRNEVIRNDDDYLLIKQLNMRRFEVVTGFLLLRARNYHSYFEI